MLKMNESKLYYTEGVNVPEMGYTAEDVYDHFTNYIWYISLHIGSMASDVLTEPEELVGELNEEMVKGFNQYGHLPFSQLSKIIKTMILNRIGELRHRYYGTHRKAAVGILSTDSPDAESAEDKVGNPAHILESKERVAATRMRLGESAKKVFDAVVMEEDPRVTRELLIVTTRAYETFEKPNVRIKPAMVARALGMEIKEVEKAFREIKKVYGEVCYGISK